MRRPADRGASSSESRADGRPGGRERQPWSGAVTTRSSTPAVQNLSLAHIGIVPLDREREAEIGERVAFEQRGNAPM